MTSVPTRPAASGAKISPENFRFLCDAIYKDSGIVLDDLVRHLAHNHAWKSQGTARSSDHKPFAFQGANGVEHVTSDELPNITRAQTWAHHCEPAKRMTLALCELANA